MEEDFDIEDIDINIVLDDLLTNKELNFKFRREIEIQDEMSECYGSFTAEE